MSKNNFTTKEVEKFADDLAVLAIEAVEKANSGHPGAPMGMARILAELFLNHLNFHPLKPDWDNRDRFVLSAGHASAALYSLLYLVGYPQMTLKQLKNFRQWGSLTAGHPEYHIELGIETTTGPLGQGISTAIGMALAALIQNNRYKDIFDHKVYTMASEGDIMEGVSYEACSLAGHLKLHNLVVFLDRNHITIDGEAELSFSEDIKKRFESQNWLVYEIDGHEVDQIRSTIHKAKKATKPVLIICQTHIGWRSQKQDKSIAHGSPLGQEALDQFKQKIGFDINQNFNPSSKSQDVKKRMTEKGQKLYEDWLQRKEDLPQDQQQQFLKEQQQRNNFPANVINWPNWEKGEKLATRNASGQILEELLQKLPQMIGGSADLTPSNNTLAAGIQDIKPSQFSGRYIRWGIREHAMGAILNGLSLHSNLLVYGGTFLIFSDYLRPSLRLAALMKTKVVFVFTHDSIGLGEDGPTHQPIEQLCSLRAIPNLQVIRPADANETSHAWRQALEYDGPTCLILTRQNINVTTKTNYSTFLQGGYVLHEDNEADITLMATGSEVSLAIDSQKALKDKKIKARVVSLPCWKQFQNSNDQVISQVMGTVPILGIEAGSSHGWGDLADYMIGIDEFGASAPGSILMKEYGFSVENVVEKVQKILQGN